MSILKQAGILFTVYLGGQVISAVLPFAMPASITAMVLLFCLLLFQIIKLEQIDQVGQFFLQNMPLLFIPAGVSIMENYLLIESRLPSFVFICMVTTVLTFLATVLAVQGTLALMKRLKRREKSERNS